MTATLTSRILGEALDRIPAGVHETVDGLDEKALTYRPDDLANSIAWLVWHLSREQDVQLAGIARLLHDPDTQQVWSEAGWHDKFNLPFPPDAMGYGQDPVEAAKVIASAAFLTGYADDVHARALDIVGRLTDSDYDAIVDESFDPPVTVAVRLVSLIDAAVQHLGQAAYVRGLYERL